VLELEEAEGGTRVHVTETAPQFGVALALHALSFNAGALAHVA
jgi:hypothetical protein